MYCSIERLFVSCSNNSDTLKRAKTIDPVMNTMEKRRDFQIVSHREKWIDSMAKEYCSAVDECEDDQYFQNHTKSSWIFTWMSSEIQHCQRLNMIILMISQSSRLWILPLWQQEFFESIHESIESSKTTHSAPQSSTGRPKSRPAPSRIPRFFFYRPVHPASVFLKRHCT